MKPPSKKDALTELIHSLTKNESGYFVKYAKKHGLEVRNDYLWLFQKIKNQPTPNWGKIEIELPKDKFKIGLANAKRTLYDHILTSMTLYAEDTTVEFKLRSYINAAKFLSEKGLLPHAQKVIEKGKRLAEQYDEYHLLLNLCLKERNLVLHKIIPKDLDTFFAEQQSYLKVIRNNEAVFYHTGKLAWLMTDYEVEKLTIIQQEIEQHLSTLAQLPSDQLSFWSRQRILFFQYHYEMVVNHDNLKTWRYLEEAMHLFKERAHFIKVRPILFLNLYISYSFYALIQQKYATFNELLSYTDTISFKSLAKKYHQYINYQLLLVFYLKQEKLERAKELIETFELKNLMTNNTNYFTKLRLSISISVALYYYQAGSYQECIEQLNTLFQGTILSDPPTTKTAFFILCAAYNKTEDKLLLESTINRLAYYLQQRKDQEGYDVLLLKVCKLWLSDKQQIEKRVDLYKDYQALRKERFDLTYETFDLDKIIGEGIPKST